MYKLTRIKNLKRKYIHVSFTPRVVDRNVNGAMDKSSVEQEIHKSDRTVHMV